MSETRQRWRIVFAREEAARYLSHLDAVTLWERALRRGGVPVATTEGFTPRPRLVFAAPLQLGMLAEHELADIYLSERLTAPDLRRRLAGGIPAGYRVTDLHDVWTGAPAIAPQLAAADYRVTLLGADTAEVAEAAAGLIAAESLPRVRRRENRSIEYDLRPLLLELRAAPPVAGRRAVLPSASGVGTVQSELWMRLRHSQDGGSGRPDEVVAAIAGVMGLAAPVTVGGEPEEGAAATQQSDASAAEAAALEAVMPVRERLWLVEDLEGVTGAQLRGGNRPRDEEAG